MTEQQANTMIALLDEINANLQEQNKYLGKAFGETFDYIEPISIQLSAIHEKLGETLPRAWEGN